MSPGAGLGKGAIVVHYGCVEVWEMEAFGIKVDGRGSSHQGWSPRRVYLVLFSVLLSDRGADYSHPLLLTDKKHTQDNPKFMLYSKYFPSHPIKKNLILKAGVTVASTLQEWLQIRESKPLRGDKKQRTTF